MTRQLSQATQLLIDPQRIAYFAVSEGISLTNLSGAYALNKRVEMFYIFYLCI